MGALEHFGFILRGWRDEMTGRKREIGFWVAYLLVAGGLWLIFWVIVPGVVHADRKAKSRANLHNIQLAVERFAVDTEGNYPRDAQELIERGYIGRFPVNPFSGEPMRALPPGVEPTPGDFRYIPVYTRGQVDDYRLRMTY